MRKVEVMSYNPDWTSSFKQEADQLRAIFGPLLIAIHHIGSTSVPGLSAKPIIDILPVVTDIEKVDLYNLRMEQMGYECNGENGLAGRRFFQKGGDDRTHHVHIYEVGNPEIDRHLAFRDYIRAHPIVCSDYGHLKKRLAEQFPLDIESYIEGKNDWVETIEKRALDWWRSRKDNLT